MFVTGGSGALGQALQAVLNEQALFFETFAAKRSELVNRFGVYDEHLVKRKLKSFAPDYVIHLASTFSNNLEESYTVNVKNARVLCIASESLKQLSKIILIGSAAEYGYIRPEENPVTEAQPLKPTSVYGLTKAWQTHLGIMHASRGLPVVVGRVFNLIGPHVSDELFAGRLQRQINEFKHGRREVFVFGNLEATRDYLSTRQAAEKLLILARSGKSGEAYNIASGHPVQLRELLHQELQKHGIQNPEIRYDPSLSSVGGHGSTTVYADISKIQKLTNAESFKD